MSIMQMLLAARGLSGYLMDKSLRFRASASAYLNRTFGTATSRTAWTYSTWVKLGQLGTNRALLNVGGLSTNYGLIFLNSVDQIDFQEGTNGAIGRLTTTPVYRDPSAWYHLVFVWDSSNATSSSRMRIYVNGVQVTAFLNATYPSSGANGYINSANVHWMNAATSSQWYQDGYQADTYFIDGQALTPASFGETNALTGVWQPKAYTGTYGTNGFYLDFETTTSVSALGTDKSGNGNTWTVNNISLTAGVTYDSMTDVPTLTSASAANYAVLNPLDNAASLSNANLTWTSTGNQGTRASFFVSSAKWYWEITSTVANQIAEHGVAQASQVITGTTAYPGAQTISWGFSNSSGNKSNNNVFTNIASGGTTNDVIMVALDCDNGKIWWGRNGTWFSSGDPSTGANAAFTNISGSVAPMTGVGGAGAGTFAYNFGQRPFAYTPPTGFKALNAFNLLDSAIVAGNKYFDASLYTGNGSTQTITNSGSMQPDFVWVKSRSSALNHGLFDSVRGVSKALRSNLTDAEDTSSGVTSFDASGFTLGAAFNQSSTTFVGWQWKAGGSAVTNTAGTISSQVSANTTSGFSVVTYTGTGANATVGHGLGVAPKMIIVKQRNGTFTWRVYHASLANTQVLFLSAVDAVTTETTAWNSTTPTSSVFSVGTSSGTNGSTNTYVAYCFADIDGFSKFGGYTGNGSTDGAFIYTGFRPRYVMVKQTNNLGNWIIWDTARSTYNQMQLYLSPNNNSQELNNAVVSIDSVSNGFKCRTSDNDINGSGDTYIYMAFAENPFKNSLAR